MGDEEAKALVDYVDSRVNENNENNLKVLSTKEDISLLKQDILKLDTKIAETKTDMIKWLFSFFFALAYMILCLYFRK